LVPQDVDHLEVEPAELSMENEREFDDWVRRRLSEWSSTEIRAFDRWLLEESHFEFVRAVRAAGMRRALEEPYVVDSEEPAA
jgi:hypothetical protein